MLLAALVIAPLLTFNTRTPIAEQAKATSEQELQSAVDYIVAI